MDKSPKKQEFYEQGSSELNIPFMADDSGHRFFLRANFIIVIVVFVLTMLVIGWGYLNLRARFAELRNEPSRAPIATCEPRPSCLDQEPRCIAPSGSNFCSPTPTPSLETSPSPSPITEPSPEEVFCTQEALECPDGSFVGRQGPTCEFTPCPPDI